MDKQYWEGPGREPGGDRIRATLVLRCQDVVQRTSGCVHLQMSGTACRKDSKGDESVTEGFFLFLFFFSRRKTTMPSLLQLSRNSEVWLVLD